MQTLRETNATELKALNDQFNQQIIKFSIENQVLHKLTALIAHEKLVDHGGKEVEFVKIPLNAANNMGSGFGIIVKTMTGKRIDIYIQHLTTVVDLKFMIQEQEGFPVGEQRFIYGGKQLLNEACLRDYGIKEGSTIY